MDAGFAKLKYFDAAAGVDALLTAPISEASALQRLGRAGRTQPGKCYRSVTSRHVMSCCVVTCLPACLSEAVALVIACTINIG